MTPELDEVPFDTPAAPKVGPNGHAVESFETATPVLAKNDRGLPEPRVEKSPTATPETSLGRQRDFAEPNSFPASSTIGRSLPHSLEAEEYLLACCLIDGETIQRCLEARIGPYSFYDTKHGIVFERLLDLHGRKIAIDVAVLAEELKLCRQFEQVGGYSFLLQVSGRVPTTAQASYFVEKVREQALLRELIRTGTGIIEDCYQFSGGIDDFSADVEGKLTAVTRNRGSNSIVDRIEASRYDPERRLPDVAPVFYLGKVPICTRGNLIALTALSKVGKSSFLAALIASTFRDPDHGGDTFTVRSENPANRALIHFDTEQHGKHHERMMDSVMRRAGAMELPGWLNSYARKGVSAKELRDELELILRVKAKQHGGIHSVMVDGIADLAADVNDPKECNPLVSWLESLAVTYDCPIVCVLHLNPVANKDSVQKSRGHLGSQLQRKIETDIRLRKEENDVTVVYTDPQGTRGQPVFEKDGPRFAWDQDAGMHVTCGNRNAIARNDAKLQKVADIMDEVFDDAGKDRFKYGDFLEAIARTTSTSKSRAEVRFSEMKALGLIKKDLIGFWTRAK